MKFSLECDVKSKTKLAEDVEIEYNNKMYVFSTDDRGYLAKIKIISPVLKPENYFSKTEPPPEDSSPNTLILSADEELNETILKDFQYLESALAFVANVKRVEWDNPKYEYIPETEEEAKRIELPWVQMRVRPIDPEEDIDREMIEDILLIKDRYDSLIVPMALFREGRSAYSEGRFINAFFNFYFVVEGLLGNGKTKNRDVEKEFKKSPRFLETVEWLIQDVINKYDRYENQILAMLKLRNKTLDVDNLIELIVKTRGDLYHFSNNPNKTQGTPFNHSEFRAISRVLWYLSYDAIQYTVEKIDENILNVESDLSDDLIG